MPADAEGVARLGMHALVLAAGVDEADEAGGADERLHCARGAEDAIVAATGQDIDQIVYSIAR